MYGIVYSLKLLDVLIYYYLTLVEETGKVIRADKRGSINQELSLIHI